jgi:hypothetical protein
MCSAGHAFTTHCPICDLTDIRRAAVKTGPILSQIWRDLIVTQQILLVTHICNPEVKEQVELQNLCTDHVMTRSELKYLFGGKVLMLKSRVFGGKTGPFPVGQVFRVVATIATVGFHVEPEPIPTWEFAPVANTTTWCHFSMANSSDIYQCLHLPTLQPVAFPTAFHSIFC